MAFILILSPNNAPPVFRLDGSTETMAIFLSLKSSKNRLTNSSTILDLPDPPVPVIPKTGIFLVGKESSLRRCSCFSGKFSREEMTLAISCGFCLPSAAISPVNMSPTGKSHCFSKSLIMPCSPIWRPSSGEYILAIP